MNRRFIAFEAFRRRRMAMLGAFSAWVKTQPNSPEIDEEITATADVMVGLSALADVDHTVAREKEGVQ